MEEALEDINRRSTGDAQPPLLLTPRTQMQRGLARVPVGGDLVKATALRSQMAALFDAEFDRMEVAEVRGVNVSPPMSCAA
ncbi:hypothetical protein [Muricoccus nepalensis]|uniref:hypothetical protein n=1 Tax=Muricoccus nepalensis TaxID=1854500 RepID=UPI00112B02EE|nr:hypothetical protein [Roseomonas nepalensis]